MNFLDMATLSEVSLTIARGMVVELLEEGEILVEVPGQPPLRLLCDFLRSADAAGLTLQPGDGVLVSLPRNLDEKGCVLGRIGTYRRPEPQEPPETTQVVVQADKELVLKCGEGSITIRADGKVLIKGKDLVSHAQRSNRIKGGSVAIN
ncbi:MAG: hypothetical protein L0215_20615 [Gemmataceae bacterium]|nr:hypothetical protein [Gemmataceae bacterium]